MPNRRVQNVVDRAASCSAAPQTTDRAGPMGGTSKEDEHLGFARGNPPLARRGGYRLNFSSSPKATARAVLVSFSLSLGNANARPRRERDNPTASQPDSLARLAYALRNRFFNRNPLRRARGAGVGDERGLSTRFSNHQKVSIRRQPRGSFGANATLAIRVTNTALSPALFGWASDSAALITLYYKLRSLFRDVSTTLWDRFSRDCPSQ